MTSIHVDDKTAAQLAAIAAEHGWSIEEYLRLVVQRDAKAPTILTTREFDGELESLLFDGPGLPADFSRGDIYADHD